MEGLQRRTTLTTSMKKNISKLKAQAQAMISTEEMVIPEGEEGEEEENSDEENEGGEEARVYHIERQGWKIIHLQKFTTNPHLLQYSSYV